MTGIPGGFWAGKFVAVCDPDPPPSRPGRFREILMRPLPGHELIQADLAMTQAGEGLNAYGLSKFDSFRRVLQNAQASRAVLVQRLDRLDSFYYIVLFTDPAGVNTLAVAVDARTAVYRQAVVRSTGQGNVISLTDRNTARGAVVGRSIELPARLGRVLLRPEAICQYPTLVWKTCLESLSPFYPFHLFSVGAHQIYVRVDGAIFTELHDDYRGI